MLRRLRRAADARGFAAFRPFHGLSGDLRLAWRRLLATPQFLAFAVLSLALGVGVTTSAYSILYSLEQPLRVAEPGRTVFVVSPGSPARARLSSPDFDDLKRAQRSFQHLAAYTFFFQTLSEQSRSEVIVGEAVTTEYFPTVGVQAAIGRTIQPFDDESGAAVIVLSDRVWRTRFDADPSIAGRVVRLGGHPFEVIGVAPPGFDGFAQTMRRSSAWIPMTAMPMFESGRAPTGDAREWFHLNVVGLLRPGATPASATAELGTIARRLDASYPLRGGGTAGNSLARHWSARLVDSPGDGAASRIAVLLVVALIGLVLVVACLNLANLMLARGSARQREFAVRRALGAPRWRLVRELSWKAASSPCSAVSSAS